MLALFPIPVTINLPFDCAITSTALTNSWLKLSPKELKTLVSISITDLAIFFISIDDFMINK